jgi:hypothetical protein
MGSDLKLCICDRREVLNADGAVSKAMFLLHGDNELLDKIAALPSTALAGGLVVGDDTIIEDQYGDYYYFVDCDIVAECIREAIDQNPWNSMVADFLVQLNDRYKVVLFWL